MKLLSVMVVLPILLFGALRAVADVPRQKTAGSNAILVSKQTYSVEAQDKSGARNQSIAEQLARNLNIAVTLREVIVSLNDYGNQPVSLVAFDRSTGRELWRKEWTAGAGANALFRSDDSSTEATPRNAQAKQTTAYLQLLGTASRQDGRSVVVLVFALYDDTQTGKRTTLEYALHCLEAESGHEIWRFALESQAPVGVYGNVIALINDDHANFLDAFTGQPVLLSTPEGKVAIKQAGEQYGTSLALFFAPDHPRLLHLDTGTIQPVDTPRGYANLIGMMANRGVIFVNMDDDYAGHSVWPHYVYGVDGAGKQVWQFPTRILLPGADFDMATGRGFESDTRLLGRDFEDVVQAQVAAASNIALVLSGTPYQVQKGKLTGLRTTDGRVLWRKPSGSIRLLRTYERGCFALMTSGQLAYIDAQTGQQQQCGKLPACENILVADKDLFTVSSDGTIAAYDIARLILPASAEYSRSISAHGEKEPETGQFVSNLQAWKASERPPVGANLKITGEVADISVGTTGSSGDGGILSPPFAVVKNREYRFGFDLRSDNPEAESHVLFTSDTAGFEGAYIKIQPAREWKRFTLLLRPNKNAPKATLNITAQVSIESKSGINARFQVRNVALLSTPQKKRAKHSRR